MLKTPDYTHQLTDTGKDLSRKAHKAWKKQSKERQTGIFTGLVALLVIGLMAMVWRAGRSTASYYKEEGGRDDDWF